MADTWKLSFVQVVGSISAIAGCAEADGVATVLSARPDGDALAAEGLRHFPQASFEADVEYGGSDAPAVIVGNGWYFLFERG
jgi:hypothetical protein